MARRHRPTAPPLAAATCSGPKPSRPPAHCPFLRPFLSSWIFEQHKTQPARHIRFIHRTPLVPFHSGSDSFDHFRIGPTHLGSGLVGCEHPIDTSSGSVSLALPCGDLAGETFGIVDTSIQALAVEDADLDLDHVEPTGVLGRVVEFQTAQDAAGFGRREGFVEGARRVGRQIVLHDANAACLGIMDIDEVAHAVGIISCGAPRGDLDPSPRPVHVKKDEQIGGAVAAVLIVVALQLAGLGRDGLTDLADELHRGLVEADYRALWIGRFGIEIEHVFHACHIHTRR